MSAHIAQGILPPANGQYQISSYKRERDQARKQNQQKYKKEYAEYDKKLDTWLEQYEQSKKKQEQGQAFKKGGAKKKYTSDIINSTNYLFAEHPLFKKKKQSKKRIYDPKAKYYQFGGLTRLTNLAGKTLKLPPAILNESNILPIISNLKPASSISKDLKIAPGVKGLLADARYRSGIENGFPLPVKNVRHAADPLHAVARGCLIAAQIM